MESSKALREWLEEAAEGADPLPKYIGELAVVRDGADYGLRHRAEVSSLDLKKIKFLNELREITVRDEANEYRPLKSARGLRKGWKGGPYDIHGLREALELIYPGAIGLWYQWLNQKIQVFSYRAVTARLSGRYRIAASLKLEQINELTHAWCENHCVRRRLWEAVEGAHPVFIAERYGEFPLVCPEACAFFLEKARGKDQEE